MAHEYLSHEAEEALIRSWQNTQNQEAFHHLIDCYTPLVLNIVKRYKGYRLAMPDLIQEGLLGIIKAALRFDLKKGVRFSAYAKWWAKSCVQMYVLKNWSVVRSISTPNQRKLFFNLNRLTQEMAQLQISQGVHQNIADLLNVSLQDVQEMQGRIRDISLSEVISKNSNQSLESTLHDSGPTPEEYHLAQEKETLRHALLEESFKILDTRERNIIKQHFFSDSQKTLSEIGKKLGITKERVRQIEHKALRKLHFAIKQKSIQRKQQWVLM